MPHQFKFKIDHTLHFHCQLISKECIAHKKDGHQCKRMVVIGLPYCWTHLLQIKHLRIKQSTIPALGKGLFAIDSKKKSDEIVFKKGETITNYQGEILNTEELHQRYDKYTAPYAVQLKTNTYIDAARVRGVGSLANHNNKLKNAEFITDYRSQPQQVKLRAIKDIKNNSEIFISYGKDYKFNEPTSHSTS